MTAEEEQALKAYCRELYLEGYNQAKQDIIEKAEKWWYEHLVGFLKEGLTEGVIAEFKQFMEEN